MINVLDKVFLLRKSQKPANFEKSFKNKSFLEFYVDYNGLYLKILRRILRKLENSSFIDFYFSLFVLF